MARKPPRGLLKFTILALALNVAAGGAAAPAISVLIDTYKGEFSETLVMLIVTIPQFCLIIVAPIFGKLSELFKRRTLLFFSFACFLVGGVGPAFVTSLPVILALRLVLGVSLAILMPLAAVLIDDFYSGQEKTTMLGLNIAFLMLGATVLQLLVGFLASIYWQYAFFAYFFIVWVAILAFFVLPEPERRAAASEAVEGVAAEGEGGVAVGGKAKMPKALLGLFVGNIAINLAYYIAITNLALLVEGSGFGDSTMSGIVFSVMTVGSVVTGLSFGILFKKLHAQTITVSALSIALGFALCFFSNDLVLAAAGAFFVGIGGGLFMSGMNTVGVELSPQARVPMTLSLMTATMGLGQTIQPLLLNPILGALGLQTGRQAFGAGAVLASVLAVVFFIVFLSGIKKKKAD